MKFSIFLQPLSPSPADDYRVMHDILGQSILADELGYDGIFLAEHSFTGETVFGEPIVFATAIAMKTQRIDIGFAVLQLVVHQPVRTALQLAVLDNLSNGRLRVAPEIQFKEDDTIARAARIESLLADVKKQDAAVARGRKDD